MREIKFRAWVKKTESEGITLGGYMDYEPVWQDIKVVRVEKKEVETSVMVDVIKSHVAKVNDIFKPEHALTQFTGLRDKNGKEIYEKDILVRFNHDEDSQHERLVVEWDNDTASYVLVHTKDDGRKSWINMKSSLDANMGVIGNIYENPELLTPTNVEVE